MGILKTIQTATKDERVFLMFYFSVFIGLAVVLLTLRAQFIAHRPFAESIPGIVFAALFMAAALGGLKQFDIAKNLFLFLALVVLAYLIVTGGDEYKIGLYSLYIYPLFVFFLAGGQQGLRWLGAIYLLVVGIVILQNRELLGAAYSSGLILRALFNFTLFAGFFYLVERSKERFEQKMLAEEAELEVVNQKLRAEIAEHQKTEKKLSARTAELEKLNALLVGREMKMIELKKENEALKKLTTP